MDYLPNVVPRYPSYFDVCSIFVDITRPTLIVKLLNHKTLSIKNKKIAAAITTSTCIKGEVYLYICPDTAEILFNCLKYFFLHFMFKQYFVRKIFNFWFDPFTLLKGHVTNGRPHTSPFGYNQGWEKKNTSLKDRNIWKKNCSRPADRTFSFKSQMKGGTLSFRLVGVLAIPIFFK